MFSGGIGGHRGKCLSGEYVVSPCWGLQWYHVKQRLEWGLTVGIGRVGRKGVRRYERSVVGVNLGVWG